MVKTKSRVLIFLVIWIFVSSTFLLFGEEIIYEIKTKDIEYNINIKYDDGSERYFKPKSVASKFYLFIDGLMNKKLKDIYFSIIFNVNFNPSIEVMNNITWATSQGRILCDNAPKKDILLNLPKQVKNGDKILLSEDKILGEEILKWTKINDPAQNHNINIRIYLYGEELKGGASKISAKAQLKFYYIIYDGYIKLKSIILE